jgi:cytochrome oxidase Cu insertion factor (SCO1/SenC/PrrC family)
MTLGLGLAALGILAYVVQIKAQRLVTPWYMPIAATLGLVFLAVSLWKKRTVWRILALLLVGLLAGAEWALLLASRLPAYTGPVVAGQSFPPFATMQADGTPFTERDLEGDQNSVLVFFRGRW